MFFPDSIWNIIKEYVFVKIDEPFMFREIEKAIRSVRQIPYEISLSFYYQAKHQFPRFLEVWFETLLQRIKTEREKMLRELENDPRLEWKISYLKSAYIELEKQKSKKIDISELWKNIYGLHFQQFFEIDSPIKLFLSKCHKQRIKRFIIGSYILRGLLIFSNNQELGDFVKRTTCDVLMFSEDNILFIYSRGISTEFIEYESEITSFAKIYPIRSYADIPREISKKVYDFTNIHKMYPSF